MAKARHNVMSNSGLRLFKGFVTHTRTSPTLHRFKYSFFQIWLDVENTTLVDNISRLWSSKKTNLVRFNRKNYLPNNENETLTLHQSICKKIQQQTGKEFQGKAYLLASLSYWGYCYNPVSFYICYNHNDELEFILSEIHNTPWGERFTYVHDIVSNVNKASSQDENKASDKLQFKFDKQFHVSPFMPMDLKYDWQFQIGKKKILISMNLHQQKKTIFNTTLNLQGEELTQTKANQLPFYYPFMCFKVLFAIYWNALRLWAKGITFFGHPNS